MRQHYINGVLDRSYFIHFALSLKKIDVKHAMDNSLFD